MSDFTDLKTLKKFATRLKIEKIGQRSQKEGKSHSSGSGLYVLQDTVLEPRARGEEDSLAELLYNHLGNCQLVL